MILATGLAISAILFIRKRQKDILKWVAAPSIAVIATVVVAVFQPFAVERIDAGCVGLKFHMVGSDQGVGQYEYKSGWVLYNTWFTKVIEIPTYQQHVEYDKQTVITKGGFSATIKPSFNYQPVPTTVGDMYVSLRHNLKEVEQGWLKNAIVGSVNDVANKYQVDSIFNDRERFEASIIAECNKRVGQWFVLTQLRTNITPPPALQAAIEAKTKAVQEVQVAEQQKLVAEADAQRKIAVARGEAEAAIIAANGRAKAIEAEQLSLTPLYLDYIRAKAWNGVLPSTMLGGASNVMIPLK